MNFHRLDKPWSVGDKIVVVVIVWGILFIPFMVRSEEHYHSPADATIHEKFYSNWMRPDNPTLSCCNLHDCYPTPTKYEYGHWWGLHRESGRFILIPADKIERERDNPDGRSHMCASSTIDAPIVYCVSLGTGY